MNFFTRRGFHRTGRGAASCRARRTRDREAAKATRSNAKHPAPPDLGHGGPEDAPEPEFRVKRDLENASEPKEAWRAAKGAGDLATTPKGAAERPWLLAPHRVTQTGRSKE